ncbi:YmfL family putative regulatory protein [Pseudomonas sp. ME-P-057]|uniref:YmfL family putative regulatory protein n=1 Tax=Pseudomonas sp. ME-P-057 TaxID=3040321 RepID=UPI002557B5D9|nr:YmfL family putative regulatory protein [Pseudomonas sp. ME-P-057]
MKRSILTSKRQVMSAVICSYPGGRECAAARLGYPLKKFDNHVYENAGGRPLSDDQVHLLEQDAGTTYFPEYVAAMYGGMYVPLAKAEELDNVELYSLSVNAAAKRGVVDQFIAKALEDGAIDRGEADVILAALTRYIAARQSEVLATIQLHSRTSDQN